VRKDSLARLLRLAGGGSARSAVLRFALTGLLVLVLVGFGSVELLRSAGRSEAVRDARQVNQVIGQGIVAPAIDPGLLRGERAAIARMDRLVRRRVINSSVVRVKLWLPSGRIVYSDEHRLIGSTYPLGADDRESLLTGSTDAEISDLHRPENRFERGYGKLMEVYLGIRAPGGRRLLFETYQRYSSVASSGRRLWLRYLPVLLGALALLAVLQIPLAWALAHRVRGAERERLRSLERGLDAQVEERRRIAGDLHDGVVQTLVGVSYRLGAAEGNVDDATPPAVAEAVSESARETRDSIRQLRSLLVDIYPPSLEREGLVAALQDLMSRASIATWLEVPDPDIRLSSDQEALLFRSAQEALRNAVTHAAARNVTVSLGRAGPVTRLEVRDDGAGFDAAAALASRPNGHFGLRALDDLVREHGGVLRVDSAPGSGTRVVVEVPS
jgi:two-component system, NarL family, sensor kinase